MFRTPDVVLDATIGALGPLGPFGRGLDVYCGTRTVLFHDRGQFRLNIDRNCPRS